MSALERLMVFLGFADSDDAASDGLSDGRRLSPASRTPQEIVVLHPRTFDDARAAADYLKMRRPVVVNLRGTPADLARRIVDFASGVAYALDGHLHPVAEEVVLFAPSHVVVTADPRVEGVRAGVSLD